MDLTPLLIQLI